MGTLIPSLLCLLGAFPLDVSGPILYSLHRGKADQAFNQYIDYVHEGHSHDFSLLQQAAKALLEEGIRSEDLEIQLM
ncbi:MAG: hypothetical protein HY324_02760, partial [Chlamydiia bacterium]|nr:hypothetical protein [Chlamydiia bacterium]